MEKPRASLYLNPTLTGLSTYEIMYGLNYQSFTTSLHQIQGARKSVVYQSGESEGVCYFCSRRDARRVFPIKDPVTMAL